MKLHRLLPIVAILVYLISVKAYGQTTGALLPNLPPDFRSAAGIAASGAKLCAFAAGTTTPLAIYSNSALTTTLPNPNTLDSVGRPTNSGGTAQAIYIQPRNYKFILYPATATGVACPLVGTPIWSRDNVYDVGLLPSFDNIRLCDRFPGSTAGVKISAAIADLPSTGGVVDCRGLEGNQTISSSITVNKNALLLLGAAQFNVNVSAFAYVSGVLSVEGLSPTDTVINLSGNNATWNFDPTYTTSWMGFSNLSVVSNSTTRDAVVIGDPTAIPGYVNVHDVKVTGPGGTAGTAHGIRIGGIQVSQFQNVAVFKYPGDCLRINGENSGETHFYNLNLDSCGDWGVDLIRTTITQAGGWYFNDSIISNRDGLTVSGGLTVIGPTSTQSQLNFNFIGGGVDSILGGDAMLFKNTSNIKVIGAQIHQSNVAGTNCNLNSGTSCFAAIHIYNVNNAFIDNSTLVAASRTVWLDSILNLITINGNVLLGDGTNTVGYFIETSGLSKGFIDISNTTTITGAFALGMITNSFADLGAVKTSFLTSQPQDFGRFVGVTCAGSYSSLVLRDQTAAAALPNKSLCVSAGTLKVINNAFGATPAFQVEDDGDIIPGKHINQLAANDWAGDLTITAGNTTATGTFATTFVSAPTCVVAPFAVDPGAGAGRFWYTSTATTVVVHITTAVGGNIFFSYACHGNPN